MAAGVAERSAETRSKTGQEAGTDGGMAAAVKD